jgi:alpha-D-ribose 1-methylphosphonate 5-triphosphate synthase subunit PhnG
MGGTGDPFNLGEMTVSRASVKLSCGTVGHGYVKGRAKTMALRIALCDALLQTADANKVDAKILQPLIEAKLTTDKEIADKAAATKVDFFTLVRGE